MAAAGPGRLDDDAPLSDINITPFVDVVLVLLVIFMVTAPALVKDSFGIKLPKASNVDQKSTASLGIAVNRQGQILYNGESVSDSELIARVKAEVAKNPDTQGIISADQDTRHADVVRAIDLIKTAGLSRFGLQIERKTSAEDAPPADTPEAQ